MIDYNKISNSISFYEKNRYTRIETPWLVPQNILNITKPIGASQFYIPEINKCLVASAEQSFLTSIIKGRIPRGRYQSVTPCFRNDENDILHHKYFIKNELIQIVNPEKDEVTSEELLMLDDMIDVCKQFFSTYISSNKLHIVETKNDDLTLKSFDIICNEIELGSYGVRKYLNVKWIYGTGCAEPRLTTVCEIIK